jgi:hypothetical protein
VQYKYQKALQLYKEGAGVAQHNKSPNQIQQVRPKIYSTEEEEKQIRLMGEEAHLQS